MNQEALSSPRNQAPLSIYTDLSLDGAALALLTRGIAENKLTVAGPKNPGPDLHLAEAEIILGQPEVDAALQSKHLRWLQIPTAGFTRYDSDFFRQAARERGLLVTNSSAVYEEACAEHLLAFMLAQARCLPGALQSRAASHSKFQHSLRVDCRVLQRQSAVILGYGSIAEKLLALLAPFSLKITAYRRQARGTELLPILKEHDLSAALAQADHVINILPANSQTRHFFNDSRLSQIRPGAVFYNIGRGATVDQEALARHLLPGRIAAAWLDVTDPEPLPDNHQLWSLENCYITPHIAGGHQNESGAIVRHFLNNYARFLAGEPLLNRII